ncbi:MAG: 2-amino-4-hydroxy-6-hydroxymethyldihydropteridine diphosphokinase, partial [Pseudohongiellaceae bacterium]
MSIQPSTIRSLPADTALVALGANLPSPAGTPAETLRAALAALAALSQAPLRCSCLYQSAPQDCPPGAPDFVNAVAMLTLDPATDPRALLERLQALEARFGRRRSGVVNEARTLDLDLLGFGERELCTPGLVLPHPRAAERAFVLRPLADLAPALQLPGWPVSVQELLDGLPAHDLTPLSP